MRLVWFWPRTAWLRLIRLLVGLALVGMAATGIWLSFKNKAQPVAAPEMHQDRAGALDGLVERLKNYYRHKN
ncbi:hypothetical protein [Desulfothermobacter acidiphilus]|uniref:hypothetical protein n=1 Tax=Desulfothermobacter acidiphilus TaxID=1938353 RepID=UPI003F8C3528